MLTHFLFSLDPSTLYITSFSVSLELDILLLYPQGQWLITHSCRVTALERLRTTVLKEKGLH